MSRTGVRPAPELLREARALAEETRARAAVCRAWELLQERDEAGTPRGPLPYTEGALIELAEAHARDPDDVGVVHHLAIARHARAWDLELRGDAGAAAEWERALGFWRALASSSEFWAGLRDRLRACAPDADPTFLDGLRRGLIEDLLAVHVDFIRHYCELGEPDRALAHVELVRRASIAPAAKKRLTDRVFEAMTGPVGDARAAREFASALETVERFLSLFPDTLRALRLHAEIGREWVAGLSYQQDWDEILDLGRRCEPRARRLAAHADLGRDALAAAALVDLARELMDRGRDRTERFFAHRDAGAAGTTEREETAGALEFAVAWGRLARAAGTADAGLHRRLADCLNSAAVLFHMEVGEITRAEDVAWTTRRAAACRRLREAIALAEEALDCEPENEIVTNNLRLFREDLDNLEGSAARFPAQWWEEP